MQKFAPRIAVTIEFADLFYWSLENIKGWPDVDY